MKANQDQQRGLITLLNRIYGEIRDVEARWNIRGSEGDFRPRIEYFHDAVRTLTEREGRAVTGEGRLSVEMLAYDIEMLRYIQAHPLGNLARTRNLSPKTDVVHNVPRAMDDTSGLKPDASVKHHLAEHYKSYAVFFAALLSDAAERNYMSRIGDNNHAVEDIADLVHEMGAKQGAEKTVDIEQLAQQEAKTDEVLQKIQAALRGGALKKRMSARDAERAFKEMTVKIDKESKALEQAHFTYATGQLAIFEGARDVVKKMAVKGLNIVGDFVESAVQDARRGDRGR